CWCWQCRKGGGVALNPIAQPDEVGALYPPTYYTVNRNSPLYLHGFIYRQKIRGDIKRIRSYADVRQLRSIVDIGCGDAAPLFELRKLVRSETGCIVLDLPFQPVIVKLAEAARVRPVQRS